MNARKVFILMIFLANCLYSHSQSTPSGPTNLDFLRIPVPPSPNAAALGKFGEIPVSKSTGIPSITIPFYRYHDESKFLDLSVAISYHAGGHKVEDMASNVGLGWALNAGGVISRTLVGLPDEMPVYGYLNTPALLPFNTTDFNLGVSYPLYQGSLSIYQGVCQVNATAAEYLMVRDITNNTLDGGHDIFNLNIGNLSAKFFFSKDGTVNFTTHQNIKINFQNGNFLVLDDKGTKYYLETKEYTFSDDATEGSVPAPPQYVSAWYLTRIESFDGLEIINFSYELPPTSTIYYTNFHNSSDWIHEANPSPTPLPILTNYTNRLRIFHNPHPVRISGIDLPDGSHVQFSYGFSRADLTGDKALTEVAISGDGLEKKFTLSYDYFQSDLCPPGSGHCTSPVGFSPNDEYKRLKLVSVTESGLNNTALPPYTFTYDENKLPVRNSKNQDWWGYYSVFSGSPIEGLNLPSWLGVIPQTSLVNYDRPPTFENAKAWILTAITYPTGGNSQFTYELNDAVHNGSLKLVGGLRVKEVRDFDPVTNATYATRYTYKTASDQSSGIMLSIPSINSYWEKEEYWDSEAWGLRTYYHLKECVGPTQTLNYLSGSPVIYARVIEEKFSSGNTNGKIVYEFFPCPSVGILDEKYPFVNNQTQEWANGLLTKKSVFNSNNELIEETNYEYDIFTRYPLTVAERNQVRNLATGVHLRKTGGWGFNEILYGAKEYFLITGRSQLKKETKMIKDSYNSTLTRTTEYTYNDQYLLNTKIKTINSVGETEETRIYYPFNYTSIGFPNRENMLQANRVNNVVSVEKLKMVNGLYKIKNATVKEFGVYNGQIRESNYYKAELTEILDEPTFGVFDPNNMLRHSSFKLQGSVSKYDVRGRISELVSRGNEITSYLWDKSNTMPIAFCNNASNSSIAFTSFESDGTGNWSDILAANIDATTATVSGYKCYNLTSSGVKKSGLNAATNYVVTYWSKNGAYSIGGTIGPIKEGKTVNINGNNWTLYEHLVGGQTTITVSGTGKIDELRLYPPGALMTTYTHRPLIGITGSCDANNVFNYYEYDGANRLKAIRDQDGNILKTFEYKYQQAQQ